MASVRHTDTRRKDKERIGPEYTAREVIMNLDHISGAKYNPFFLFGFPEQKP